MILLFTGRENDLENPSTENVLLEWPWESVHFFWVTRWIFNKIFLFISFFSPPLSYRGSALFSFRPQGFLGSLIRFTLNTFASVSNSSRSAVFSLVTLSLSLELPRSASNSHVRLLSSNSHVRPRTPTFGFVLELSRSASNSHVRLCPRTLTFGLELSRSAVSSNSHVRPRNLTIGCVTSFCFAHFSFSNSPVRPRTPTFGCATFFRTFSLFNHLICESLWFGRYLRPRPYWGTVLTHSCVLSCHHLMSSRMRVSFLGTWVK